MDDRKSGAGAPHSIFSDSGGSARSIGHSRSTRRDARQRRRSHVEHRAVIVEVAIAKEDWNTGEIRFFQIRGGGTRTIAVHGYVNLGSIDWAPDSKSMFMASSGPSGTVLLRVNLDGSARPVWQQSRANEIWGIPSPDGRHLALSGFTSDANVWMVDNF